MTGSLWRSFAGAFLTLLAWSLLAPSVARAGCGPRFPHVPTDERLIQLLAPALPGGEESTPNEDMPPAGPERPRRCDGPTCSEGPSAPPIVPDIPEVDFIEPWAHHGSILAVPKKSDPTLYAERSSGLRSILVPSTIFRPPRPVAVSHA